MFKRNENNMLKKILQFHIHYSTPVLFGNKLSVPQLLNKYTKWISICSYTVAHYVPTKINFIVYYSMGGTTAHYSKWNKPYTIRHLPHDLTQVEFKNTYLLDIENVWPLSAAGESNGEVRRGEGMLTKQVPKETKVLWHSVGNLSWHRSCVHVQQQMKEF